MQELSTVASVEKGTYRHNLGLLSGLQGMKAILNFWVYHLAMTFVKFMIAGAFMALVSFYMLGLWGATDSYYFYLWQWEFGFAIGAAVVLLADLFRLPGVLRKSELTMRNFVSLPRKERKKFIRMLR